MCDQRAPAPITGIRRKLSLFPQPIATISPNIAKLCRGAALLVMVTALLTTARHHRRHVGLTALICIATAAARHTSVAHIPSSYRFIRVTVGLDWIGIIKMVHVGSGSFGVHHCRELLSGLPLLVRYLGCGGSVGGRLENRDTTKGWPGHHKKAIFLSHKFGANLKIMVRIGPYILIMQQVKTISEDCGTPFPIYARAYSIFLLALPPHPPAMIYAVGFGFICGQVCQQASILPT